MAYGFNFRRKNILIFSNTTLMRSIEKIIIFFPFAFLIEDSSLQFKKQIKNFQNARHSREFWKFFKKF